MQLLTRFTSQICYEKSNSELSNRCLGLDCGQSCKEEAHQHFLSCDLSSWKGVYKSAWEKRDLIATIHSFTLAQAIKTCAP